MDEIEVRTTVRRPPEAVFRVLRDFRSYPAYSKHLRAVDADGDGGVGTAYRLRFGWWKLTYDAHTRVTDVVAPTRLDWEVTRDIAASGRWLVEEAPEGHSEVRFVVEYDPDSVSPSVVDLPRLVSIDWVVDTVVDLIEAEGRRVVERVVADLEGESRPVELTVDYR
ncbi:MAG: SRPBCC family protein [Halanaeroarchaeum sp.]